MLTALSCLAALLTAQGTPAEPPRLIVTAGFLAIEGDSAPAVQRRWEQRLAADSADRAARLGLATLASLSYDHERAATEYQRLESVADEYRLYGRVGQAYSGLWQMPFDSTVYRFLRAAVEARTAGDSSLAAEALAMAGFLGSRLGALGPALDSLAAAERLVPKADARVHALILCIAAPILSFAGRPEAWHSGQRGLEYAHQAGVPRMVGLCYQALSSVAINETDDATIPEAYTDSAETVQRAARDGALLAFTHYNQGYSRWVYADLAGSKQALNQAVKVAIASRNPAAEAWARRYLSVLYWSAGDVAESVREFGIAESLFTRLNDGLGLSHVRVGRAIALLHVGRIDEAETAFRRQLAISEWNGSATGVYFSRVNLAAVHTRRGNWAAARAELDQAIAYGDAHGQSGWTRSLDYSRGMVALRLGNLDEAERQLRTYLRTVGPTQYIDRYATRTRLAEVAARRGDLDRAEQDLEYASRQLDSLRQSLNDDQLKLLVFQTRSALEEPDLGLAPVAALLIRSGRSAAAFRLAERQRARTLTDRLLRNAFLRGDSAPTLAHDGLPDVARIQAALPANTALVEYLAGRSGQPTTAFVITRGGVHGYVLPPIDSLFFDLDRVNTLLQQGEPAGGVTERLSRAFLLPVLADLADSVTHLVVVPDDRLHNLPFDALPLADGRPVMERFTLSLAPSALFATRPHPPAAPRSGPILLVVGDPRFANIQKTSAVPETEVYRNAYQETGGLPRLAGSRAEAREVARFAPGSILRLEDGARESYFKQPTLAEFQVIHFATHALVDEQSQSRTSLALAPGDGEDGFLGAVEIEQLKLKADLVVLSACRTAGGRVIGGEGVQGLTAPLLSSGVRSVVATLWSIGDRRTTGLVRDFYRGLAGGQTAAAALRQAKLESRRRGEPASVWAAFTLVGDPDITVPLTLPRPRWPLWLGLGSVLAVALLIGLRRVVGR